MTIYELELNIYDEYYECFKKQSICFYSLDNACITARKAYACEDVVGFDVIDTNTGEVMFCEQDIDKEGRGCF